VLSDFVSPDADEVPRQAWDGIWLDGGRWGEDIMTGEKAAPVLTIEPAGGYFSGELKGIKITSTLPDAAIFYTTDGSEPDTASFLYLEPITVRHSAGIKAIAYIPGRAHSYVKEALFIDSSFQTPPVINKKLHSGLKYRYFETGITKASQLDTCTATSTGTAETVNFQDISSGKEKFGFIFEGYLSVPSDGRYVFYLNSNDGSRLFINGYEVINNDGRHGAKEKNVILHLRKGFYPVTVKYFQYGGGKELKLMWEGPGFGKKEIEKNYFYH
jgi:hypothetical protein